MSDFLRDPPRWKDRTDQAWLAERAAGKMVRSMGKAEPLSDVQLARIAARIRGQHAQPHRLRYWVPAMAVLLFAGVAAASAAHFDLLPHWFVEIVGPGTVPAPRIPSHSPHFKPSAPAPAPTLVRQAPTVPAQPAPADVSSPPAQPIAAPQPVAALLPSERAPEPIRQAVAHRPDSTRLPPTAATSKPTQAAESGRGQPSIPRQPRAEVWPSPNAPAAPAQAPAVFLPTVPMAAPPPATRLAWVDRQAPAKTAESTQALPGPRPALPAPASQGGGPIKYLSSAVHALRVEHSPEAALALLDRHAGDLERSSISHEVLLLRVEAMLKLNRQPEVLLLLDAAPLAGVAASRTLLLTRGELRAAAGRCAEAVSDFDSVLVQTQGHNKRALAGRAKCQNPAAPEPGPR